MKNIAVPDVLVSHAQTHCEQITFVHYRESAPAGRNLITFGKCAVSFILSGQKELHRFSEKVVVNPGEGIVIPDGNSIIAERKLESDQYSSLVIFFPKKLAQDFHMRNKAARVMIKKIDTESPSFIKFGVTAYLNSYVEQLLQLIAGQVFLSPALAVHKLEELLLILSEIYPGALHELFHSLDEVPGQLKKIVEQNLLTGLTIPELAFLTNRSLATFKRDFEKAYGCSPGKYIRERKMDIASHALLNGQGSSELSLELGYENLSNFNTAFKRKFGQTPEAFRNSNSY